MSQVEKENKPKLPLPLAMHDVLIHAFEKNDRKIIQELADRYDIYDALEQLSFDVQQTDAINAEYDRNKASEAYAKGGLFQKRKGEKLVDVLEKFDQESAKCMDFKNRKKPESQDEREV